MLCAESQLPQQMNNEVSQQMSWKIKYFQQSRWPYRTWEDQWFRITPNLNLWCYEITNTQLLLYFPFKPRNISYFIIPIKQIQSMSEWITHFIYNKICTSTNLQNIYSSQSHKPRKQVVVEERKQAIFHLVHPNVNHEKMKDPPDIRKSFQVHDSNWCLHVFSGWT